jgi:hypothetical protein
VALILVAESPYSLPVGQTQSPLGTLQCLDGRLLVNADDQCIFRWLKIETYDIRSLLDKLWVCAHAPTPAAL